ncbi:MAG TPA: nitrilase-related carbon-nitrogen hydrolase [Polyangiaceae bacterium]|nr:nitrilase-related carbon-nitrogen hydrolase [Polyangiaceae bacterium]
MIAAYGEPGLELAPLFLLGFVALAFLSARARSYWSSLTIGLAFGAGLVGTVGLGSIDWGTLVPIGLTAIGTGLHVLPFTLLSRWVSRKQDGIRAFVFSIAVWALCMEFAKWLGFPVEFETLSLIASAPFLLAGARIFGSSTICGFIGAGVIGAGARLARLRAPSARELLVALRPLGAALVLLLASSGIAHVTAPRTSGSLEVGVPQMNVPSEFFRLRQALPVNRDAFEALFANQMRELQDVDLLALTETYDGGFPLLVPRLRRSFQSYAKLQHQAVLLTSYLVADDGGGYNAVGAIDQEGKLVGVHRKVNLAPFGEMELERGPGFRPAEVLPNVRVGVLICQEALLADGPRALTLAGANLLVTPTSDVSFKSGIIAFVHLAGARLRALEVGRAMIWASAAGPSGVIDRWGDFREIGPFRSVVAARMKVETSGDITPFLRLHWLWLLCDAIVVLGVMLRDWRRPTIETKTAPTVGTLRGLLELALAGSITATGALLSPAVDEFRHGEPTRAKQAVLEILGRAPEALGPASLARFATDPENSAAGALAYYLDCYGVRTLPSGAGIDRTRPTLDDLQQVLDDSFEFPARRITLNFKALPETATLVVTRSGQFGVLTSNRYGLVLLFLPGQGGMSRMTTEQASHVLMESALIPAPDPELARFGR